MRRLLIAIFAVAALLAISLAAQPVSAGVEPSPFWPQENHVLNKVKKLDEVQIQLERVLNVKPGEANGIYKHRLVVIDGLTQLLGGETYDALDAYVKELPTDTTRGRNAAKVLGEGADRLESIIETVDLYLRNPDDQADRVFIGALSDLRTAAEETLPLVIEAWEKVGGVEPSPF